MVHSLDFFGHGWGNAKVGSRAGSVKRFGNPAQRLGTQHEANVECQIYLQSPAHVRREK